MGTGIAGTHNCKLYVVCLHNHGCACYHTHTASALQVPAVQQPRAWHIASSYRAGHIGLQLLLELPLVGICVSELSSFVQK